MWENLDIFKDFFIILTNSIIIPRTNQRNINIIIMLIKQRSNSINILIYLNPLIIPHSSS